MLKRALTLAVSLLCGGALAQITFNGTNHGVTAQTACNITHASLASQVTMGTSIGGAMTVSLKGHTNATLQRGGLLAFTAETTTYNNFSIGNFPVQISTYLMADSVQANGKLVIGGGAPSNTSTLLNCLQIVEWAEFVDADADGVFDEGVEDSYSIGEWSSYLLGGVPLQGNGFHVYDIDSIYTVGTPYVLGAQRNYYMRITQQLTGIVNDLTTDPFHVITHEFNAPYTGWQFNYTYQAVPEPTTFAGLGAAFVALVSRRKKKTSVLSK